MKYESLPKTQRYLKNNVGYVASTQVSKIRKQQEFESFQYLLLREPEYLAGFLSQVNKRKRWMPRQSKAKKDVAACEKPRGVGRQALIRGYLNGETHPVLLGITY